MPPTLEEILTAIQAVLTARQQETGAEASFATVNTAAEQATATERATFEGHQATYDAAVATARAALGWPASLAQLQAAIAARAQAETDVLAMMSVFVAATPSP